MLDTAAEIVQSNVTKELHKRLAGVTQGTIIVGRLPHGDGKWPAMHDFLIALAFVAMIASPVVVASMPKTSNEQEL
jgi:hypothetical protein